MLADPATYWRRNLYVCLFGSFTTLAAMTLLLPFLPFYVAELGVKTDAAIVQWSGVAFGATFLGAGLVAPLWGKVADRYGRKLILVRASLCMALTMSLIGLAQNVGELVALRFLAGLLGGYSSGAVVLVATQTPRERAGWALGTLSVGAMTGNLTGPLIGGILPGLIGIRETFFLAGSVIFIAFLATLLLIREQPRPPPVKTPGRKGSAWSVIPDRRPVFAMLATATLLMLANMSIEPIISVYVGPLVGPGGNVPFVSGLVMAASALGSILAAARLGRLADRIGAWTVVIFCLTAAGLLLIPQAFVTAAWQLIVLRFFMGVALAGLLPSVNAMLRLSVPDQVTGTILGYAISAQFAGQVLGPLLGGFVGAHTGLRAVFCVTAALMLAGAAGNWLVQRRLRPLGMLIGSEPILKRDTL